MFSLTHSRGDLSQTFLLSPSFKGKGRHSKIQPGGTRHSGYDLQEDLYHFTRSRYSLRIDKEGINRFCRQRKNSSCLANKVRQMVFQKNLNAPFHHFSTKTRKRNDSKVHFVRSSLQERRRSRIRGQEEEIDWQ